MTPLEYARSLNIVFVVGVPRSGTTWVLFLLSGHPDCRRVTADMLGVAIKQPTAETGLFLKGRSDGVIISVLNKLPSDKMLVEKTPAHVFAIERIKTILPNAKVVLVERSVVDVLRSMTAPGKRIPKPISLGRAIHNYKWYNDAVQKHLDKIDYTVRYEDLWANPITEANELFTFCGLNRNHTQAIVEETTGGKALPVDLRSCFRQGSPGDGVRSFTKEEMQKIRDMGLL
jgi:hypothetical protein